MAKSHDITRNDANDEIRLFLKLRAEFTKPEVLALLSEPAKQYLQSTALSFGFEKQQIESLFSQATGNAYRIYFAADVNTYEPTLIVVACTIDFDTNTVKNELGAAPAPGRQYPPIFRRVGDKPDFDLGDE